MCWEALPKFSMSITETFYSLIALAVINEYDKGTVTQIPKGLRHVCHVACRRVLWNRTFWHLSNHVFGVGNFGNTKAMRTSFFSKCLKFNIDFKNAVKISEKVFCFSDNLIWFGTVKLSLLRTGYFSLIANVLTSSTNVWHLRERLFPTQFPWQWSMNMIKVLWCRFQKCLATFTMLLVERSSQTGLLRHLYDYVFAVRNFGNRKCLRDIFFFKIFEI